MALASAVNLVDFTRRRKIIGVAITPSGNYVAGGDTLDLSAVTNPQWLQGGQFGTIPALWVMANNPNGYGVVFIPGTTLANGKLQFFTSGGAELAAAAYPAAVIATPSVVYFSMRMWVF